MVTLTKKEAAQVSAMAQVTSKNAARPALTWVNLRKIESYLEVWASDSIRLALLRIKTPDDVSTFGAVSVDAKALAQALKTSGTVSLEVVDAGDERHALKVTQAGYSAVALPSHQGGITYESALHLTREASQCIEDMGGCYDPSQLASLCRVAKSAYGKNARLQLYPHGMKAAYLYALDRDSELEMLLMPCRR